MGVDGKLCRLNMTGRSTLEFFMLWMRSMGWQASGAQAVLATMAMYAVYVMPDANAGLIERQWSISLNAHSPDKTQRESDFRWVLFSG